MIKKQKCNICNNKFYINPQKVYKVKKDGQVLNPSEIFDAIDCPKCNCQILLWKRLKKINKKES